eukprot:Nk52_evm5s319 gene=Nk52_evmTU5s319
MSASGDTDSPLPRLNVNIGVLGHVDSGKTTLSRALSTVASTAAFDKNPQSRERGITLDLGFSSFGLGPVTLCKGPEGSQGSVKDVHVTLVDCPGHASLIRTIIGGAQIIDLMLLVVDATKGIQTQTAECLVIGEVTCRDMIVVLNKTDMLEDKDREGKVTAKLKKALKSTVFASAPICPVSAKDGQGLGQLLETLKRTLREPERKEDGPFVFSSDHCFAIKGHGTIFTGTVLSGRAKVNDLVEIPQLREQRKIKSMQVFRKPVTECRCGDRVGVCVTQVDAKMIERGYLCSVGSMPVMYACVLEVKKIRFFRSHVIRSGAKYHITTGHETVMAKILIFSTTEQEGAVEEMDFSIEYSYEDTLEDEEVKNAKGDDEGTGKETKKTKRYYMLLEFDQQGATSPPPSGLVIGSKLDNDIHTASCRLAFHGRLLHAFRDKQYRSQSGELSRLLRVVKVKQRQGSVDRVVDEYTLIGKGLFKKETNMSLFEGTRVLVGGAGENEKEALCGRIEGGFGQGGKFKVQMDSRLDLEEGPFKAYAAQGKGGKNKNKGGKAKEGERKEPISITTVTKKNIFDSKH